ncbi:MAG: hypothetical protein A2475_02370 [Ignavibacteria bacterium RIFOXYC2_FULL_35_21]|nr:MAG: hypothetical protein A2220_04530 [Ignavibacteria bacterium RIFOXYA2_FULL_35_10]OGV22846.1 MAG: hypothetical protein A2475_02370 [Ignavibacteria bacterium RIFOXYC2_FULL_35_21]
MKSNNYSANKTEFSYIIDEAEQELFISELQYGIDILSSKDEVVKMKIYKNLISDLSKAKSKQSLSIEKSDIIEVLENFRTDSIEKIALKKKLIALLPQVD